MREAHINPNTQLNSNVDDDDDCLLDWNWKFGTVCMNDTAACVGLVGSPSCVTSMVVVWFGADGVVLAFQFKCVFEN